MRNLGTWATWVGTGDSYGAVRVMPGGYVDYTGMPSRAELCEQYARGSGLDTDEMDYYVVLARFKIAIVSNIDDDLFAFTRPRLGIDPDYVITAEQVRSYKPGRAHFDELLSRTDLTQRQILHIGESRFHDVEPAAALGFSTVWLNRTGAALSASGPAVSGMQPTHAVSSMEELARLAISLR